MCLTAASTFGIANSFLHLIETTATYRYIVGVTKGMDLAYLDAASGKPLTTPAIVRDASWATATVPAGFNVQGLWPEDSDVDIQTVDRSSSEKIIAKVMLGNS